VVDHSALASEQAAGCATGRRPQGAERHLLADQDRFAWADIPKRYGPATTCSNRFRRWAKIGVWDRIFDAVSAAYDGALQMVDSSSIRVHQHGGNGKKGARTRSLPPLGTLLEPSAWGARAAG
jgi:hypothetical protein